MLKLNNISGAKGSNRNTKRLGRGQGSGQGTQAGKGHKGQRARSGGNVRFGFEGGSMPLYMRIPKSGTFTNARFKKIYAEVNLNKLEENFSQNELVSQEALVSKGLLKGVNKNLPVKILGKGKLAKALVFSNLISFSRGALQQVEKSGGKINK